MKFHTFINKMGTTSLFCEDIGDIYYSYIGAYEEAMQKFVLPSIEENFSEDIKILDICYGLGFNSKSFVNYIFSQTNFDKKIFIDAVEIDKNILALSLLHYDKNIPKFLHDKFSLELLKTSNFKFEINNLKNNSDFHEYINNHDDLFNLFGKNRRIIYKKNPEKLTFVHNIYYQNQSKRINKLINIHKKLKISFKINNILLELPKFKTCSYDLVFLDGFSPSKQPELWSEKVFSYIYKILKPNGKILTYTRSNIVRRNMSSSGLVVYDIFDENNNVVGTVGKKVI